MPSVGGVHFIRYVLFTVDLVCPLYQHCIVHFLLVEINMASSASSITRTSRSARLGLRATPEQEAILRRAADIAHKSLTDFILDSACHAAEQTLLDQRLFVVSGEQYQDLLDMLDQPAQDNQGLQDLFSRNAPWEK